MGEISADAVLIRHIQGLAAVLHHLPKGGGAHQLFQAALDSDPPERSIRVGELDSDREIREFLESHWGEQAHPISHAQGDSDIMTSALAEVKELSRKLHPLTVGQ